MRHFIRFIAALVLVVGFARSAAADGTGEVVVLLHPSLKSWSDEVEAGLKLRPLDCIVIPDTSKRGYKLPMMRVETGATPGAAKGWRYLFKVGPAKEIKPNIAGAAGAAGVQLSVPFTLYFREGDSGGGTPIVAGALSCYGRDFENAGVGFGRTFAGGDLGYNISAALGPKVSAEKVEQLNNGTSRPVLATVPLVKEKTGDVSVRMNNRLRVGVRIRMTSMRERLHIQQGEKYLDIELVQVVDAGAKPTLTVPKASLLGLDVKWTEFQVTIADTQLTPAPEGKR